MTNKKRVTITAIILITLTGGLLLTIGGPGGLDDIAADPDEYQATPGDPNDN